MSNHCASCGKADANSEVCNACKLVKYCGAECQVAHRPVHKKACEKAFNERLYAQPPRKEECPICMITLPCNHAESLCTSCCGKLICLGCHNCLTREQCPFCNTAFLESDEEIIKRLSQRIEKYNDPEAMSSLGSYYNDGLKCLPVDQSKAFELFQRASELGFATGHCNLGISYERGEGTGIDKKKAVHHWQIAAMMGNVEARHSLGFVEWENGNYQCAMKHSMIAAKSGYKISLENVMHGYKEGVVTKEDLEKTLRDYQASCDETKSEQRDRAAVIRGRRE